ncbi:MAG: glycerol-3-phosphate acyltransferase [Lachnospiraceae bacterium]|nr:glycerol-3-phosphate acyltransferase [Lachnospiraceae bacterium]
MNSFIGMIIVCIVLGYGVGCINLSFFLGKLKGFDIRDYGSGNAGASNLMITMGKKIGVFVALLDVLKAFLIIRFVMFLYPGQLLAAFICADAVVIGNIFPFYMGFKGGKGFASLGGSVLAIDFRFFVVLLIIVTAIVLISDYICFAPIFASIAFPVSYSVIYQTPVSMVYLAATAAILYRHYENLKRIAQGKELRFSFLWNRKREAERLGVDDDHGDGKTIPFRRNPKN